jgi:hypothetical protein
MLWDFQAFCLNAPFEEWYPGLANDNAKSAAQAVAA